MRPSNRLGALPLRTKVVLTVLGAAVAVLGASTYFSFRYWQGEALQTVRQQALMAAASTQATLESALRLGRPEPARHSLSLLRQEGAVTAARVYREDGEILLSADPYEEGRSAAARWIPSAAELPRSGLVNVSDTGSTVRAFLPLSLPEPGVLEVQFSVAATRAAMERGARLGIGLMAVSLLAVGVIVVTMFEREVVAPLHRIDVLMGSKGQNSGRKDEMRHLERSVTQLLEKEREVQARAADQNRRLAAQEGLAQVGELAAEMAHEFKRPLASIRTAVEVLRQEYELDSGGEEMLGAVRGQLEHLQETMQDLFSLAKPVVLEEDRVEVAELLDEALSELAGLPGVEGIDVERRYAGEDLAVQGDARRLRQAILNVLTNAVEALGDGGRIVLALDATPDGVEVAVSDDGPGLHSDEIEKILKPFYSTKPQGTGLGLPLVARIISAHGGTLAIESRPGAGTTVRIRLPAVHEPLPRET